MMISSTSGSITDSSRRFASAAWYQTLGISSGLSVDLLANRAPARVAASTADLSLHGSGVQNERTRTGTGEFSLLLQMPAAYWNAMSRCSPIVVPVLFPTGVAGVGSLKP